MMKIGRNEPCPCGSGAKVKRCCGVDGVQRAQEALEDLLGLAFHFPRQRPSSASFDAWAESAADRLSREAVEEGLGALGVAERARIPNEFADAYPEVWQTIMAEAGGRDDAVRIVLVGAVVAGLEERQRPLDLDALDVLEADGDARSDPVESLALVLVAGDLWNVLEVAEALESFNGGAPLAGIVESLWSEWHERRLAELVHRLEARLPIGGFPNASAAVESACRAFRDDHRVPARLRVELLLDALPSALEAVLAA